MFQKIKWFFCRLRARFPEELPTNEGDLSVFIDYTLLLYRFPQQPDYKRALAKAIHGLSQGTHKIPRHYLYTQMRRYEAMMAAVKLVTTLESQKQAATPKEVPPLGKTPETPN